MKKNIWKIIMFAAVLTLTFGFALAVWSVSEHYDMGIYLGLATIAGVCVSWWFWVMFIILTVIKQNEKTRSDLNQVRDGITHVKQLVKDYVELSNISDRQRGKSKNS